MIKKFVIYMLIVLSICLCLNTYNTEKTLAINTSAKSMVAIETTSKRILFEKNSNERLAMASTTKIATALTVLTYCDDIDKEVKVDDRAVGIEGTSMYIKKGETLTIKDLLYGMMLPSGNDASMALAIAVGGSKDKFVSLMNKVAKNLGALNTNFKNPHGLDEKGHYTTAYDLALITAKALENNIFREIVNTKNVKIKGSFDNTYRYLKNKNKLLFNYEYCTGVKTGYTDDAKRCLVSSAMLNGMEVVCVVLNCGPMFEECRSILDECFKNYKLVTLLEPYLQHKKIIVNNGKRERVGTFSREGFKYPLTEDEYKKIMVQYEVPDSMNAPIKKELEVGKIKIYLDNHLLFSEKIFTMEEVKEDCLSQSIKDIISKW